MRVNQELYLELENIATLYLVTLFAIPLTFDSLRLSLSNSSFSISLADFSMMTTSDPQCATPFVFTALQIYRPLSSGKAWGMVRECLRGDGGGEGKGDGGKIEVKEEENRRKKIGKEMNKREEEKS